MADEDVIRRRLLIDGDGTGDDRRLNVLLKSFMKWCDQPDTSVENNEKMKNRLLSLMLLCEHTFKKSRLVAEMSTRELENYEHISKEIEQKIEETKKEMEKTKKDLESGKLIRKNRMEYDILAEIIKQHPDRLETTEKLKQIEKELISLKETEATVDKRIEMRRKQFHVMISSIHQLEAILKADKDNILDNSYDAFDDDDLDLLDKKSDSEMIVE
ncbi:unnamed protein product [Bemisia tabaci]|uniref:THO complex subunit 7 homolog n=1 Tax=Bemisia tabaci TaxID=7038 RepID=A0A9P0A7A3_BEMTA|nr:PREDICTED: THO complex subunit 7 homolog [Bemisia tabaci]CAH0388043.1 unnamed protein product [Bemisia tabaci]